MFDFSSLGSMFGNGGFDMGSLGSMIGSGSGGSTGGWDYWIKAIQDGVIGQSAGFDTVKQNEEGSPLAMEARGQNPEEALSRGTTKGDYVYNLEGDAPFLADMYKGFVSSGTKDPLRYKGSSGATNNGQNNASGSNAALDKSLNPEARKIAGISEGGATPQLNAGDTSFNSMMDAFGDMHLPLDTPKERQELFGKKNKQSSQDPKEAAKHIEQDKSQLPELGIPKTENLNDPMSSGSSTTLFDSNGNPFATIFNNSIDLGSTTSAGSGMSGIGDVDWMQWLNMFGGANG